MPRSRLIALIVGLVFILGLTLWLIDAVSRLSVQCYYSPLLCNLLLLLLIGIVVSLIGAVVYYVLMIQRGERRSRQRQQRLAQQHQIPIVKTEAAEETLQAVRQQVAQIQDEVARQALLSRSQEIEANLARGELQVVVFGTGSAGKTSLVNAIIGRVIGRVDAPMGTTQVGETYRLRLRGLERRILITDTPGILEAGVAGTEREQMARQLATEADLLLFVVDNDLRHSEYDPLRTLAEIGKRSLLVLNKTDLYTDEDKETILARLRERVRGFISPTDLVAIAANPQSVTLENGEIFQPEPDIMPLLRRMAAVLRAEGEDLVADNILLQSQRLGEEARKMIDAQRRRQAEQVVERFQWIGAGVVVVTPLPGVDLLATAAINAQMVVEIGKIYGCELNLARGKDLALSLAKTLASLGIVKGAFQLMSITLQTNVGTFIVGRAIQGVTAAYLTHIAGKSFIEYFRQNQDWGDGGITEVVQRQFQLNRRDEFVQEFVQQAIARVIRPLTASSEADTEIDRDR
ncbi:GTP-binding protein [Chroococcidiopsis sp. CCMEE 29]|uniref:YcjF family protein n=1 Tax=Chroococcidiopsis sp. CCMEE 29 TaxID=155894 RepID=UPI0020201B01|nr:GTP-binding protein [Chroococcidiopsis sp. CCMEE 29]